MPQCRKKKRDGTPCTLMATSKDGRSCVWHDPLRRDERKAKSAKGGRNKARPVGVAEPPCRFDSLESCKRYLEWLAAAVIRGQISKDRANSARAAVTEAAKVLEKINAAQKLKAIERRLKELEG